LEIFGEATLGSRKVHVLLFELIAIAYHDIVALLFEGVGVRRHGFKLAPFPYGADLNNR
jgi:hypothetical protein